MNRTNARELPKAQPFHVLNLKMWSGMKILEMTQIITFSDAVITITINVCAKFENSPFSAF